MVQFYMWILCFWIETDTTLLLKMYQITKIVSTLDNKATEMNLGDSVDNVGTLQSPPTQ